MEMVEQTMSGDDVPQVLRKVETVGDLYGTGCRFTCSLGVFTATIPAHRLDPRMLPEPPGERVRASVGQNVH